MEMHAARRLCTMPAHAMGSRHMPALTYYHSCQVSSGARDARPRGALQHQRRAHAYAPVGWDCGCDEAEGWQEALPAAQEEGLASVM